MAKVVTSFEYCCSKSVLRLLKVAHRASEFAKCVKALLKITVLHIIESKIQDYDIKMLVENWNKLDLFQISKSYTNTCQLKY